MDLWLKIEEMINAFINATLSLIIPKSLHKYINRNSDSTPKELTPKQLAKKEAKLKTQAAKKAKQKAKDEKKKQEETNNAIIQTAPTSPKEKLIATLQVVISQAKLTLEKITTLINKTINYFQNINIKKFDFFVSAKNGLVLLIRNNILYIKKIERIDSFILIGILIIVCTSIVSAFFYKDFFSHLKNNFFPDKQLTSDYDPSEGLMPHGDFYKIKDRQLLVSDIDLPVYIESSAAIKSLTIDFTFESSNRYIKQFFLHNEHTLKNKLNATLETVIPSFPLTDEGKNVIKEKLIFEMNALLKEKQIEGKILKIYIHTIVAG